MSCTTRFHFSTNFRRTIMIKRILIPLLLLFFNISIFAQSEQYAVPIKWERYKIADKDVSILFPKLPVVLKSTDDCNETENRVYYAYAEEVVYLMKIYSKTKKKAPKSCKEKGSFNEKSLNSRIQELKKFSDNAEVSESIQNDKKIIKLKKDFSTDWVFDDLKNDRWFELSVSHRKNADINVKDFFESIIFSDNPVGTEINDGAKQVFGDLELKQEKTSDAENGLSLKPQTDKTLPLQIITKPRPGYTDAARQNNVQGTVTLRVTFLASGGIGSVSVVSALGYGLTEKAIAAARKIAFLPVNRNDKNINVTKSVQFSFSIY